MFNKISNLTSPFGINKKNSYVADGLQLHLNVNDNNSYTNDPSSWYDLVSGRKFNLYGQILGGSMYYPEFEQGNSYKALVFNGAFVYGHYAECTSSLNSMSEWTVEVWMNHIGYYGSYPAIITEKFLTAGDKINYCIPPLDDTNSPRPRISTGYYDTNWYNSANALNRSFSPTNGSWYHIVGRYFKVDGVPRLRTTINNTLFDYLSVPSGGAPGSSGRGIKLMSRWDLGGEYWRGKLSIVRIYNRSLSNNEVAQNWYSDKIRFAL